MTVAQKDALETLDLRRGSHLSSKETLNHPELMKHLSGKDPFEETEETYLTSIERLGIDLVTESPSPWWKVMERPNLPLRPGETIYKVMPDVYHKKPIKQGLAYAGVHPTVSPVEYPFKDEEEVLNYDPSELMPESVEELAERDEEQYQKMLGKLNGRAEPYGFYYTTLFMWPVMVFGWELFLTSAVTQEERFDRLLDRFFRLSVKRTKALARTSMKVVILHDDLTFNNGPVLAPEWYEQHIFPQYPDIFKPLFNSGKKVIFCSDGKLDIFLERLVELGVHGFMPETPATSLNKLLEIGKNKVIIGGIDTGILTRGCPEEVLAHTRGVLQKTLDLPGFFISSPGGFYGNIPLENLRAYFQARSEFGGPPVDW